MTAEPPGGDATVRAAGGLVWRAGAGGEVEVLVVHRPRYDDWSLPKGKAEPGESDEDCARREVHEETGVRVELEEPIGEIRYRDRKGRPKVVRYWRMRPVAADEFHPNDEIDEAVWVRIDRAVGILTYDHDRGLVTAMRAP